MTWKPKCKHGVAKFSFEGFCDPQILAKALNFPDMKFKMKKVPLSEFCEALGTYELSASIRYGSLVAKGETVSVKWDATLKQYKVSGDYGLNR